MVSRRCTRSFVALTSLAIVNAGTPLMDSAGNLRLQSLPQISAGNVVALISSPDTPSLLLEEEGTDVLTFQAGTPATLTCRGATLSSDGTITALATSSLVAGAIVLDGISAGDIETGLRDSRHGRTLLTIFRARLCPDTKLDDQEIALLLSKQTLVLPVLAGELPVPESKIVGDVMALFSAAALETETSLSFSQLYDLKVVPYTDADEIRAMAAEEAMSKEIKGSLSSLLTKAHSKVKSTFAFVASLPTVAQGMVTIGHVYSRQSRSVRSKLAAWKSRVARGLVSNGFGAEAEAMLETVLKVFDSETIMATGVPAVAAQRRELRSKLQVMMETGIEEVFEGQIENLEKTTLKRLNAELLKTINEPDVEKKMDSNAATLRNELHMFEGSVADLEVPSLGFTKEKVYRQMEGKLTDAVDRFDGSPAARIKRMAAQKKVVQKDKKPGQRGFDLGLDLVAVLRPDGFGSLQGFAGYQLGGNSITFGVHNDADDPQVIAQFGGVRPPLLRVQPKIRVDVEL